MLMRRVPIYFILLYSYIIICSADCSKWQVQFAIGGEFKMPSD